MSAAVAVLGATGRTGGATARHLMALGAGVRALLRDADGPAARRLTATGADVRRADMADAASLEAALDGATRLFNVQPAFDGRGRYHLDVELAQGRAVARAAGRAGVSHVVQLAAGDGAPTGVPHLDAKLEIRQAFEDAGVTVTYLCPGPFMELMDDAGFAPALSTWGAEPRVVGWDTPLPWVAVDDIGRTAARLLSAEAPVTGLVSLVGDVRSLRENRRILAEAGRRPRGLPVPPALFRRLVGPELPAMWRWVADQECGADQVTAGLMDVRTWASRRTDPAREPAAV